MSVLLAGIIIYMICFILIFLFIYKSEKAEEEEKVTFLTHVLASALLALIPAALIMGIVLLAAGSVRTVSFLLKMDITLRQVLIISVGFTVYSFSLDFLFSALGKYIFGPTIIRAAFTALFRFMFLYIIGLFAELNANDNLTVASVLTLLFLLLDVYFTDDKPSQKDKTSDSKRVNK